MKDCLYIDNHILVVAKNRNISLADFKEGIKKELEKENLKSSFLEEIYPICFEASGIVTFALSSKAKERFLKQIKDGEFLLKNFAVCVGKPKYKNRVLYIDETDESREEITEQFVHRNQKTGLLEFIPRLNQDATKVYSLYSVLEDNEKISLVQIDGGFSFDDEVRFLMKEAKSPIFGDKKYEGETLAKNTNLALSIVEVKFTHPISGKNMSFRYYPEIDKKPWLYFNVEKFLKI